jgi:hypothetical protein
MDSRKVIPISPSPQRLTRTGKLSIIPPRRSIKDHIASKEGGMSATEREKRLAINREDNKKALLCKPNLTTRTVIALEALIEFKEKEVPSTKEGILEYPISLEDIELFITHLIENSHYYTSTIDQAYYYTLIALYRHRKGLNQRDAFEPADILLRDKLKTLMRQNLRIKVSVLCNTGRGWI